ncbi:MAG: Rieske (2Fe-2S) protein [Candidatus Latescibacterota bacterium]|nr:MAG: Rieske (2Fe-2S) protein [Candidatus Latescibacterota bacterium]
MAGKKNKATRPKTKVPSASADVPGEVRISRRSFLGKLWLVIGGVALLEYLAIALDFVRPRRTRRDGENDTIVIAGPIERFEPDTVTAFPEGGFYLARLENGGFLALSRKCTHLGCTVPWNADEGSFVCPCHASAFDITGDVLDPPAPRALDLYPVRIENRIVKVDTRQVKKRRSFDPTQVTYA